MNHDVLNSFTVDDIRKRRKDFDRRHTDEKGNIDWDGANAEIEEGANYVRKEIARMRAERSVAV